MKVSSFNKDIMNSILQGDLEKRKIIEQRFPKYRKWIDGTDYPTYNQLVELSNILCVPFGYFFLKELPKRKYPINHYKTINNDKNVKISNEMFEIVFHIQQIQYWIKDILSQWQANKLNFCGKYKNQYEIKPILKELENIFEIKKDWMNQKKKWNDFFEYLINKAEEKGIIIMVSKTLNNNKYKKIDPEELKGIVLYDDLAPIIFINGNSAISVKIFTLIYGIIHLLIGKSASFDLFNLQSANNKMERFCNQCSSEFLIMSQTLKKFYQNNKDLDKIAKYFNVSKAIVLKRLFDLSLINEETFNIQFKNLIDKEKKNFKNNKIYSSKRLLHLINLATSDNIISLKDALRITNYF